MGWDFIFQFLFYVNKKSLSYAFCVKELRSNISNVYKDMWIYIEYIFILSNSPGHATIVEINAGKIEKKHYHVGKKVAHVGFVWHPDTLFQSTQWYFGWNIFLL